MLDDPHEVWIKFSFQLGRIFLNLIYKNDVFIVLITCEMHIFLIKFILILSLLLKNYVFFTYLIKICYFYNRVGEPSSNSIWKKILFVQFFFQ
jgi:hypothetical protein